jgi:hypothetical protein
MATYRSVAYDLQTSLKKTFDDTNINLVQIMYWIQVVANKMRAEIDMVDYTDEFTSTFSSITVQQDPKGRAYIDLPTGLVDLQNEKGVRYITYNEETGTCCDGANFAQIFFQPTKVMHLHRLYMDEYEKPSPSNPYFYRLGEKVEGIPVNRLYLVGIDCISVSDVEIAIMSTLDLTSLAGLDDPFPLPDKFISKLMQEVLQLGRFVMLIPEELMNEGADKQKLPTSTRTTVPQTKEEQANAQQ